VKLSTRWRTATTSDSLTSTKDGNVASCTRLSTFQFKASYPFCLNKWTSSALWSLLVLPKLVSVHDPVSSAIASGAAACEFSIGSSRGPQTILRAPTADKQLSLQFLRVSLIPVGSSILQFAISVCRALILFHIPLRRPSADTVSLVRQTSSDCVHESFRPMFHFIASLNSVPSTAVPSTFVARLEVGRVARRTKPELLPSVPPLAVCFQGLTGAGKK
jgi:hypothetical protein